MGNGTGPNTKAKGRRLNGKEKGTRLRRVRMKPDTTAATYALITDMRRPATQPAPEVNRLGKLGRFAHSPA
jgi:hypothetical protein